MSQSSFYWAMARIDILAIGNAIVDLLRACDDNFLMSIGSSKGHTSYVASSKAIQDLCKQLPAGVEIAGGAAVNTIVGISSLGGQSTFLGTVADDDYGRIFQHDVRSMGVTFGSLAKATDREETSRALVLVTPDGQRTIKTFIGCSGKFHSAFIDTELIGRARFLYLEGYLFDVPGAMQVLGKAIAAAAAAGRTVALSLSDSHCVERHRSEFLSLIRSGVGILFGNESEVLALFNTRSFDDALRKTGTQVPIAAVTRSERGSVVVSKGATMSVQPDRVRKVVELDGGRGSLRGWIPDGIGAELGSCRRGAAGQLLCERDYQPKGRSSRKAARPSRKNARLLALAR